MGHREILFHVCNKKIVLHETVSTALCLLLHKFAAHVCNKFRSELAWVETWFKRRSKDGRLKLGEAVWRRAHPVLHTRSLTLTNGRPSLVEGSSPAPRVPGQSVCRSLVVDRSAVQ